MWDNIQTQTRVKCNECHFCGEFTLIILDLFPSRWYKKLQLHTDISNIFYVNLVVIWKTSQRKILATHKWIYLDRTDDEASQTSQWERRGVFF